MFVHCKFGASRSVTSIAAYLMCLFRASPREVMDFIKSKRPEADPNKVRSSLFHIETSVTKAHGKFAGAGISQGARRFSQF